MSLPKTRMVKTGLSPLAKVLLMLAVVVVLGGGGGGYVWLTERQATQHQQATAAVIASTQEAVTQAAGAATAVAQIEATSTAEARLTELDRLYQTAVALERAGDLVQARGTYQQLLALDPGFRDVAERLRVVSEKLAESLYQEAVAAASQELWAEAVSKFDQVLALMPGYKDTATRRAIAVKELNATATATMRPTVTLRPTTAASATPDARTPTLQSSGTLTVTPSPLTAAAATAPTMPLAGETDTNSTGMAAQTPVPRPPQAPGPRPAGDWAVRTYNTDDVAVVLVNGKLVAGSLYGKPNDSTWVKINEYLVGGESNEIIVASWNSAYDRSWGFGVRRNDTQVWGSEQPPVRAPVGMNYVQRLRITAAGEVEPIEAEKRAPNPPPGKWYVRVQGTQDIGVVLVNGIPVALNSLAFTEDSGWIEVTGQLSRDRDNAIVVQVWNFEGPYSYKFDLKHDEIIVWGTEKSGGGQIGAVLDQSITVTTRGEIIDMR